jgi:hypothetical protein
VSTAITHQPQKASRSPRQYRIPPAGPLSVGDREARADGKGGELIDRIAAGAPVRKLFFVELLGHARVPLAGHRPDHRAGVEFAAIDAHRAAEAAPDLERRLDDGLRANPTPRSASLELAQAGAETLAPERGTWFDMCPGRGATDDCVLWSEPQPGDEGRG